MSNPSAILIANEDVLVDIRILTYELVYDKELESLSNQQYLSRIDDLLKLLCASKHLHQLLGANFYNSNQEYEVLLDKAEGILEITKRAASNVEVHDILHVLLPFSTAAEAVGGYIEDAIQTIQNERKKFNLPKVV